MTVIRAANIHHVAEGGYTSLSTETDGSQREMHEWLVRCGAVVVARLELIEGTASQERVQLSWVAE